MGTLNSTAVLIKSGDKHKIKKMEELKKGGNSQKSLQLVIEGKIHTWPEQYITGAQIKKLAQLELDSELYLWVSSPWKDELIENDRKVNLALPENEQFFVRNSLKYTINGVEFKSNKQFINGKFIREQGKIPEGDIIYLLAEKNWEDNLIDDHEWVDLARTGRENFVSRSPTFCIIVNTREQQWRNRKISYEQVVKLAYPDYNPAQSSYTVKYTHGPKENPNGSLSEGDIVIVKNKMKFHVTATNQS